jgi:hypothetical protein
MKATAIVVGLFLTAVTPQPVLAQRMMMGGGGHHMGSFSSPYFSEAANCSFCHNGLRDAAGNDVSLEQDWRSTMMANSARDPLWQAKVQTEVMRNPRLRTLIEQRCSTCHTPMARTHAIFRGGEAALFGEGFLNAENPLHTLAMDGVSCALCHQIGEAGLGDKAGYSGNYAIDETTTRPFRRIFGPFPGPFPMPMRMMSGFTPSPASHIGESELCGVCHTLYVPIVDKDGKIVGEAPEQTPYLEWKYSSFGDGKNNDDRSCQACHMPEADGGVVVSRMPRRHLRQREPFSRHYFVGGNVFMLNMLRDFREELGVAATGYQLDQTLSRTEEQLSNLTADITVEKVRQEKGSLEISVRVDNKTGHKFPTGFPIRRAWIHLTVTDADGKMIFESGKPRPDGSIAGNDADSDASAFEPHYMTIDNQEKVQIYEAIMMDTEKAVTYTLLRAAEHAKENRLLPKGFDKSAAPPDIRPHAGALADPDFSGGSDTIRYIISGPPAGTLKIRAALLFQPVSFAFVRDLLTLEAKSDAVRRFDGYQKQMDKTPFTVSTAETSYSPAAK